MILTCRCGGPLRIWSRLSASSQGGISRWTGIARGADSIFAEAVLDLDGKLEVLLPAANYREQKVKLDHAPEFDELMRRATTVRVMPFAEANQAAYEAANEMLVSSCDILFAVWDGQHGVDKGGTASAVKYAHSHGVPVEVMWPQGAARK